MFPLTQFWYEAVGKALSSSTISATAPPVTGIIVPREKKLLIMPATPFHQNITRGSEIFHQLR